jgi:hypothetical protein
MSRVPRFRLLTAALLSCVFVPGVRSATLAAQQTKASSPVTDSIHLKMGLFGLKYSVGQARAEYAVGPFFGVSMRQPFRDALAQHPDALAEARRANVYLTGKLVSTVGVFAGTFVYMMNAIDRAEQGEEVGSSQLSDLLVYVGIPTVAFFVTDYLAKGHIESAVDLFNARQATALRDDMQLSLQPWLGLSGPTSTRPYTIMAGVKIGGR